MHFVDLVGFDHFTHLNDFLLAQMELEKQVLHRRLIKAKTAHAFLLEEQLDKHIIRLVLHHEQPAVVNPTLKRQKHDQLKDG